MPVSAVPEAELSLRETLARHHPSISKAEDRFRFWHVESLLNKAADLLDRCLAEQASYDSLNAQATSNELAFRAEDETLQLEAGPVEGASVHMYPFNDAVSRLKGLTAVKPHMDQAYNDLKATFEATPTTRNSADLKIHEAARARWQMDLDAAQVEVDRFNRHPWGASTIAYRAIEEAKKRLEAKRVALGPGGALDLRGPACRLSTRILRDYGDAAERLLIASQGLQRIYGYLDAFEVQLAAVRSGSPEAIEMAATWVREAIRWLAAFSQKDQTFTLCLSLRGALTDEGWSQLLKGGPAQKFLVDSTVLQRHLYVRIRGLSASLRLAREAAPFPVRCIFNVPQAAVYFFAGFGDPVPSVQKAMPSCTLGRVTDALSSIEPEVGGAISLMNASPFGDPGASDERRSWSVQLEPITRDPLTALEDVYLSLLLSAQPKPPKTKAED